MDNMERLALIRFRLKELTRLKKVIYDKYMNNKPILFKGYNEAMCNAYAHFECDLITILTED